MGNFKHQTVNIRFRTVYQELSERKAIKGKSDLAKKLDTYNHIINNILKGERNLTLDQILKLSEHYYIRPDYLFGHSDVMFMSDDSIEHQNIKSIELGDTGNIALLPMTAAAGYQIDLNALSNQEDVPRFSVPGLSGELVAFEIDGDSMMPNITNGDIVICEPIERGRPLKDNQVYVIISDVVVAKRIRQIKDDNGQLQALELVSDNSQFYQPYQLPLDQVQQVLKVNCRITNHGLI